MASRRPTSSKSGPTSARGARASGARASKSTKSTKGAKGAKGGGKSASARRARASSGRSGAKKRRSALASRRARRRAVLLSALAIAAALVAWGALLGAAAGRDAVRTLAADPRLAPVEVLAAPRVLRAGDALDAGGLARELEAAGYRAVPATPRAPGEFRRAGAIVEVHRRAHLGPHGEVPPSFARARFAAGRLVELTDAQGGRRAAFTLEPLALGRFHGARLEERRPTALEEFPPRVIDAVLAAEDARFMEHEGLDARAMLRAAFRTLTGKGLQGGSTVTQQVIKNRVTGAERTIRRKLREAFLAAWVERALPKERILEVYLNEVYLGQRGAVSISGIPAAARHFFGRDVDTLATDEAALLAGMIASPGRYDPRRHPEAARARRDWVLSRMVATGRLDALEAEALASRPLALVDATPELDPAGDVLDAVRAELVARGTTPAPGERRRAVFTSIDLPLQRAARAALGETLSALERERPERAPLEGALIVLRPATGEVAALVGGRVGARGAFLRATQARRPPGSAIKPLVAAAAFAELGLAPSSLVEDEPLVVRRDGRAWRPTNADGRFRGEVSLREALARSLNVPFARLGQRIGPARLAGTLEQTGLEGRLPSEPSLALGAGEVTPLGLAQAYATLAALGMRRDAHLVVALEDDEGALRSCAPLSSSERVLPEAAAFLALDAMRAALGPAGTARRLAPLVEGHALGAKTGTSPEGRDGWFVLVGGEAVIVVWVGRDDARPAHLSGAGAALPVVRRLLGRADSPLVANLPGPPPSVEIVHWNPKLACAERRAGRDTQEEPFAKSALPPRCERPGLFERLFGRRAS